MKTWKLKPKVLLIGSNADSTRPACNFFSTRQMLSAFTGYRCTAVYSGRGYHMESKLDATTGMQISGMGFILEYVTKGRINLGIFRPKLEELEKIRKKAY